MYLDSEAQLIANWLTCGILNKVCVCVCVCFIKIVKALAQVLYFHSINSKLILF